MSRESFFVRFAQNYGWRAYAIPVLTVITVWVLYDVFVRAEETQPQAIEEPAVTTSETPLKPGPRPADAPQMLIDASELPPGGPYTEAGERTYRQVGVPLPQVGEGTEQPLTYVVEVENGIDTSGYGGDDAFASAVAATLSNPKGWTNDPVFSFERIAADDPREPDLRIQLTSLATTHELCGNDLGMETSCFYSDGNRVMINESRWVRGALPFEGDLGSYRQYLINHEVGHGLGYAGHEPCTGDGDLAPIMMQQTLSLNNSELHSFDPDEVYPDDDATCSFNPWPYPRAM